MKNNKLTEEQKELLENWKESISFLALGHIQYAFITNLVSNLLKAKEAQIRQEYEGSSPEISKEQMEINETRICSGCGKVIMLITDHEKTCKYYYQPTQAEPTEDWEKMINNIPVWDKHTNEMVDLDYLLDDRSLAQVKAFIKSLTPHQMNEEQRAYQWIIGDDTGISSKVIWAVMMGIDPLDKHTPCDPSDFGRCYRLLKFIPEWEKRLEELRKVDFGYYSMNLGEEKTHLWGKFVDNYRKMCELYEEEYQTGRCPKLYHFMQEIF